MTEYLMYVCNNCWNMHATPAEEVGSCAVCGGHDTERVDFEDLM